jgi:hypothetical protein
MTVGEPPVHHGSGDSRAYGSLPFDTSVAHQARMYDYLLGGKDNYAADREAMEAMLEVHPEAAFTARANRAFLGRPGPPRPAPGWPHPGRRVRQKGQSAEGALPGGRGPSPQLPAKPPDRAHDREDFIPDVNNSSYRY